VAIFITLIQRKKKAIWKKKESTSLFLTLREKKKGILYTVATSRMLEEKKGTCKRERSFPTPGEKKVV